MKKQKNVICLLIMCFILLLFQKPSWAYSEDNAQAVEEIQDSKENIVSETDEDYQIAAAELEEINEQQDEPLDQDELEEVLSHYKELQTLYEANPDYFGIAAPFFTSQDTDASPIGAIVDMMGMDSDNLDIESVDETIVQMIQGLQQYISDYGDDLLAARDEALSKLDDNMSDVEKCLVLHDYVAGQATFNVRYAYDLVESTSFGALVRKKCVCLGYASAYTYLVQCAFPEIYKNEDGSWKTKDEVQDTYIVDYAKSTDAKNVHYLNALRLDGQWYYVDTCIDDIATEQTQYVRLEADGDCRHIFFLNDHESFCEWYLGSDSVIDSAYEDLATDDQYETAWFSNVNSPIYYNDDYWFYVEGEIDWRDDKNIDDYVDKGDQIKARNRKTGETIVLFDYRSGNVNSLSNQNLGINEELAAEYEKDVFYNEIYPGMQHSLGLYGNHLYFNIGNKVCQYNLETAEVSVLKEYDTISVARDSSVDYKGLSFYVADTGEDDIEFTISNHPVSSLMIKDDGKMYVNIATNFNNKSDPIYSVEAVGYKPYYSVFGETRTSTDDFRWCANVKDTLDMEHVTGDSHNYQLVTVDPTCQEEGFDQLRCIECGLSLGQEKTNFTEKLTHHYVYNSKKKIYVCSYCKDAEESAQEHNYGEPTFQWNETDGKIDACQLVFVCSACGEKHTEDAELSISSVIQEASCTEDGEATYTAVCTFQGNTYSQEANGVVAKTGHSYSKPQFEWNEENYTACKAYVTCKTCGKIKNLDCDVTSKTTLADYGKEGTIVYTASCTYEGKTYKETKKETIDALTVKTSFEESSYQVYATGSLQLNIISNDSNEKIVSMKSSNTKVLKTSKNGTVTGVSAGKAKVTATTTSGLKIKTTVKVKTPKVTLTASSVPLQLKKTTSEIKVKSKLETDSVKSWSSSNKAIVTVTAQGKITAKKVGTATVTVLMKSGAKASCKIKVQKEAVKLTSISTNKTKVTMKLTGSKKNFQITAAKNPITTTNKITYSSSNKKVVTVSPTGKLTAKKAGSATITLKCEGKTKQIKVVISK